MAFITPNNGQTAHYTVSYEDTLSEDGVSLALGLLAHCEQDFALMSSWFPGVNFRFAFPISVQIAVGSSGAGWTDVPDGIANTYHPTVEIDGASGGSVGLIRYMLVAEVTEMFMASASISGKSWFEPTSWWSGGDEGSMGESLSRFLAAQFLLATGVSPAVFSGFGVVPLWLNIPARSGLDFIDFAPDDIQPDLITGCGTCFLFFLHDQLKFSINQIIAAAGPSLASVHANLTGKTDAWTAFRDLLDLHYPLDGTPYLPPMETVFPVADLQIFSAPKEVSWVLNGSPNFAWLFLSHPIPVDVKITLSSDHPTILVVPPSVTMRSFKEIPLVVPAQGVNFSDTPVKVTATYAGVTLTASVNVVRPENFTVGALQIVPVPGDNPCAQQFVEGTPQQFTVKNLSVFADQSGLTYKWSVSGAHIVVNDDPVLTIPKLPAEGTKVKVRVTVTNASNLRAKGAYSFATMQRATGMNEHFRQLDCSLRNLRAVNLHLPPWIPVENGELQLDPERLAGIHDQAQRIAVAAKRVAAAINAINIVKKEASEERAPQATAGAHQAR